MSGNRACRTTETPIVMAPNLFRQARECRTSIGCLDKATSVFAVVTLRIASAPARHLVISALDIHQRNACRHVKRH